MSEVVNVWGGECLGGERLTIEIKAAIFTNEILRGGLKYFLLMKIMMEPK